MNTEDFFQNQIVIHLIIIGYLNHTENFALLGLKEISLYYNQSEILRYDYHNRLMLGNSDRAFLSPV